MVESPIACDLSGLNPQQRDRRQELMGRVRAAAEERKELSDGYAIRLPSEPSLVMAAAELVNLERLCCPFFHFVMEIEREGGPLWLHITGRQGVKEFLKAELGLG